MPNPQPNGHVAEPRWMLYPEEWRAARERVALLPSARQRRRFWALLEHMERGWRIILPLQVAADRIACGAALHRSTADDVAAFIECDPIDVYRGIAHSCMDAVPVMPRQRQSSLEIVADEAGDVARYLRILALGADHPEFPPQLHELVRAAAMEMTGWHTGLADVLEPVEELVHGAQGCSSDVTMRPRHPAMPPPAPSAPALRGAARNAR